MGPAHFNRRDFVAARGSLAFLTSCDRRTEMAGADDIASLDLVELTGAIRRGAISSVDAVNACLHRFDRLDGALNSFITLDRSGALAAAKKADADRAAGSPCGPLHGAPIAIKDNIDVAGLRCSAASEAYATRQSTEDALVIKALRTAGAVILGKLNMHEVAFGATGAVSNAGPACNPFDRERITGGSSSGPAAAVAAGLCFAAVGTDTGGSIAYRRQCAAFPASSRPTGSSTQAA